MYALRDNDNKITGSTKWPNDQTSTRVDQQSQEWLDYLDPPTSVDIALVKIKSLYVEVMDRLSSGYTKQEIDTFSEKVTAAKAYASGSPETDDTYYLAKIDGVVNGTTPLNDAEIQAEVDGIDAAGHLVVAERAQKILDARKAFNFWTAKIEQVRNTHLAMLVEGADNQHVVDALAAIYGAIQ